MSKVVNVSRQTVVIGRFKVLPGRQLPVVPYTSQEEQGIRDFIEKGYLKSDAVQPVAAPEPEADKPQAKTRGPQASKKDKQPE